VEKRAARCPSSPRPARRPSTSSGDTGSWRTDVKIDVKAVAAPGRLWFPTWRRRCRNLPPRRGRLRISARPAPSRVAMAGPVGGGIAPGGWICPGIRMERFTVPVRRRPFGRNHADHGTVAGARLPNVLSRSRSRGARGPFSDEAPPPYRVSRLAGGGRCRTLGSRPKSRMEARRPVPPFAPVAFRRRTRVRD